MLGAWRHNSCFWLLYECCLFFFTDVWVYIYIYTHMCLYRALLQCLEWAQLISRTSWGEPAGASSEIENLQNDVWQNQTQLWSKLALTKTIQSTAHKYMFENIDVHVYAYTNKRMYIYRERNVLASIHFITTIVYHF